MAWHNILNPHSHTASHRSYSGMQRVVKVKSCLSNAVAVLGFDSMLTILVDVPSSGTRVDDFEITYTRNLNISRE